MIDLLNWFPPSLTLTDFCGFKIMKVIAHVKTGYAEDIMENNKCRNMHHGNALMANILNSMYRFRQMMPQCSCKHRNTCGQTPQQRSNHIAMLWVSHRQMVNKRDSPSMPMQHPLSQDKEIFLASRKSSKTYTSWRSIQDSQTLPGLYAVARCHSQDVARPSSTRGTC